MNVVDANVLLYAVNRDARHHQAAKKWLDAALSGQATVGFSWIVLLAFLRLTTKVGLFPSPLEVPQALAIVDDWLAQPAAIVLEPTARHSHLLGELLRATGVGGNLTNHAHLAALALEHRGQIISFDNDFDRFPTVTWVQPG